MAKASEYVRAALLKAKKVGAEQPIAAADARDALDALNDMLFEWEGVGISLGFTEVSDLGDEVTIPDYAKRAVKFNLAINVAGEYGKNLLSADTIATAAASYDNLVNMTVSVAVQRFPSTLPVGKGNECSRYESRFFPGDEAGTLERQTGGAILTEDDTE
jgi:hypothetical protein